MKRTISATVKKVGLIALTVCILGTTMAAQNRTLDFKPKYVKNLIAALQHENEGVKKDAIYYSAVYGVLEVVPILVDEFKSEKNPKIRLLIALALYKLGNQQGIDAVYSASMHDSDAKVRRTCKAIIAEYQTTQKELAVK